MLKNLLVEEKFDPYRSNCATFCNNWHNDFSWLMNSNLSHLQEETIPHSSLQLK